MQRMAASFMRSRCRSSETASFDAGSWSTYRNLQEELVRERFGIIALVPFSRCVVSHESFLLIAYLDFVDFCEVLLVCRCATKVAL